MDLGANKTMQSVVAGFRHADENILRLLSYNIHVGIPSGRYSDYVIGRWRHLPKHARAKNLDQIARLLHHFDVVALQEIDVGSLRSGFINQLEYLAMQGGFSHWHHQLNRNLGKFGQYSNGVLSRYPLLKIENHKLPGTLPGRGAIEVHLGDRENPLVLLMVHLSLGKRSRLLQLGYIAELIAEHEHVILMGDMNCTSKQILHRSPLKYCDLQSVTTGVKTFPSWQPRRDLDHVWVSSSIDVANVQVMPHLYSDHLPIALDVVMPEDVKKFLRKV